MPNTIQQRTQLEPMLLKIMATDEGREQVAALLSEFCDELRLLGLRADAREKRDACSCEICQETKREDRTANEREQLFAAMRAAC